MSVATVPVTTLSSIVKVGDGRLALLIVDVLVVFVRSSMMSSTRAAV